LIANSPKPSFDDKRKLEIKENKLQEMRMQNKMKRDVTVAISSEGFYRTGIMADIVQHAMLLPVLVCHLRFHKSVDQLEKIIAYQFSNRFLLQLALTHPSYRFDHPVFIPTCLYFSKRTGKTLEQILTMPGILLPIVESDSQSMETGASITKIRGKEVTLN